MMEQQKQSNNNSAYQTLVTSPLLRGDFSNILSLDCIQILPNSGDKINQSGDFSDHLSLDYIQILPNLVVKSLNLVTPGDDDRDNDENKYKRKSALEMLVR